MNIITTTKDGVKIKLNEGRNGNGHAVYIVASERKGPQGQTIRHSETFSNRPEAEAWVKYAF